ncbi:hypothetical protein JF729_07125 [Mycobacterium intracellulare]|nr:hypothetical protein [Mycobacterium intracellulare]MCA2247568.1 hypothetical protein [Mycobacterium intracellulare]
MTREQLSAQQQLKAANAAWAASHMAAMRHRAANPATRHRDTVTSQ